MHEKSKGDIIVYMDDDDYYPPERVSHAVNMLLTHPNALCAGSSEIYIWFKHIQKMYQFGPYGPNHATAGTFAFKRELLKDHRYEDHAALAEEKAFLKNYTVPFVQLEPKKTILVFSHIHNTFDKKKLLDNPHPQYVKVSDKKVEDFVKEKDLYDFFVNKIEDKLREYKEGAPKMKPDVLKQIDELTKERKQIQEDHAKQLHNQQTNMLKNVGISESDIEKIRNNPHEVQRLLHENQQRINFSQMLLQMAMNQNNSSGQIIAQVNGKEEVLNNEQIVDILKQQDQAVKMLQEECKKKDSYIKLLEMKINN